MSITKTAAQILTAAQTLAAVAAAPTAAGNKSGTLSNLRAPFEFARQQYVREYTAIKNVAFADAASADLPAFFTALSLADGDAFRVPDADDTTDNALAGAKGGAVVAGDVFNRVGATVVFVGIAANVPADVTGLTAALAG